MTARVPVVVAFVKVALEMTAFVVVELPTMRLVMLAKVATRDEMKEFVEVLFVVTRLVAVAFVAERLAITAVPVA